MLSREKGAEQADVDLHTRDRVTSSAVESFNMELVSAYQLIGLRENKLFYCLSAEKYQPR